MKERLALVRWILENAPREAWSVQGFGFMRMYLNRGKESTRLHIWDSSLRIPNVSDIHTHPWSFNSTVVAGLLGNTRYLKHPGKQFHVQLLKAGENARLLDKSRTVALEKSTIESYGPGESYHQAFDEIHRTNILIDGTVTLVERTVQVANPDHAYVYWPVNASWVDAEPRPATVLEWHTAIRNALKHFAG